METKISCGIKKCGQRKCVYNVDGECTKKEIELAISGESFDGSIKCGSFEEGLFTRPRRGKRNKKVHQALGHLDAHGFFRDE